MSVTLKTPCDHCGAVEDQECITPRGKKRSTHAARRDRARRMTATHEGVVRIVHDDPRLGLTAGEDFAAIPYRLDPGSKVTLLRRLSDGWNPQCNAYNRDIQFIRWGSRRGTDVHTQ